MEHTSHKCHAAVIMCIDWRIRHDGAFLKFLDERYDRKYDLVVVAGAGKDFLDSDSSPHMFKQLELSIKLHQPDRIMITAHTDCGAEGGSAAFQSKETEYAHLQERLQNVQEVIKKRISGVPIDSCIIELTEDTTAQWTATPHEDIKNPA